MDVFGAETAFNPEPTAFLLSTRYIEGGGLQPSGNYAFRAYCMSVRLPSELIIKREIRSRPVKIDGALATTHPNPAKSGAGMPSAHALGVYQLTNIVLNNLYTVRQKVCGGSILGDSVKSNHEINYASIFHPLQGTVPSTIIIGQQSRTDSAPLLP
ncbi:hypothetical protein BJX64DRAFT_287158 [Aspergillus heterothallicus]